MSKRRELVIHRKQLLEIRNIMNSMKNLAYLETRKLSKRLANQKNAAAVVEMAAVDLLQFYPELRVVESGLKPVILLIGSERGFCGDYNETLVEYLAAGHAQNFDLIVTGEKLSQRLEHDDRIIARLASANTVDETGKVLNRIVDILAEQLVFTDGRPFRAVYHDPADRKIVEKTLLPFFAELPVESSEYMVVPDTNLEPSVLLNEIAEHYLLAQMYRAFYAALMAENLSRIDHMENALRRLDEKTSVLNHQYNVFRQEEIIEEIEIILLNAKLASRRQEKKRDIRRSVSGLDDLG